MTVAIVTVVTVAVVIFVTVVIMIVATVALVTVVIVTNFNKNNFTHRQQMRYSQGSFSRFSRCFAIFDHILLALTKTLTFFLTLFVPLGHYNIWA